MRSSCMVRQVSQERGQHGECHYAMFCSSLGANKMRLSHSQTQSKLRTHNNHESGGILIVGKLTRLSPLLLSKTTNKGYWKSTRIASALEFTLTPIAVLFCCLSQVGVVPLHLEVSIRLTNQRQQYISNGSRRKSKHRLACVNQLSVMVGERHQTGKDKTRKRRSCTIKHVVTEKKEGFLNQRSWLGTRVQAARAPADCRLGKTASRQNVSSNNCAVVEKNGTSINRPKIQS